jgi:hypothetical protein
MAETKAASVADTTAIDLPDAKRQVVTEAANEFIFAVVGHIGAGTSEVARSFKEILERQKSPFQTKVLKATEVIEGWAKQKGLQHPTRDALRVFVRDKVEPGTFEGLQDEIYHGVADTADGDHTDGFERVKAVTQAAQDVSLDAHPLGASALVKDKRGICHQLANESRLKWTK